MVHVQSEGNLRACSLPLACGDEGLNILNLGHQLGAKRTAHPSMDDSAQMFSLLASLGMRQLGKIMCNGTKTTVSISCKYLKTVYSVIQYGVEILFILF